jgi:transposase-like protein
VLAFMHFPKEHWPQLASTNTLEGSAPFFL